MFKIEVMVDDNKVGKALWALDGLCVIQGITPVRNVKVAKGKVEEVGEPRSATDAVFNLIGLKSQKRDIELSTAEAQEFASKAGFSAGAVNQALQKAVSAKLLKRQSRGHYHITATN